MGLPVEDRGHSMLYQQAWWVMWGQAECIRRAALCDIGLLPDPTWPDIEATL